MSTKRWVAAVAGIAGLTALAGTAYASPTFAIRISDGSTTTTINDNGAGDLDATGGSILSSPTFTGYTIGAVTSDFSNSSGTLSLDLNGLTLKKTASGAGTLTIMTTVTGFAGAGLNLSVADNFTGTNAHSGATITSTSDAKLYISTADTAFGLGTLLTDTGALGTLNFSGATSDYLASLSGPISVTLVKTISFSNSAPSGAGFTNSASASVPEPASMSLLGTGLLGAGWFMKRRRKKNAAKAA